MNIDVSVIIPTYKPGPYIYECLKSLGKQTFDSKRFEILLILNGCKDPYESQLKAYIKEVLPGIEIKLIQINQGGVSNARNIGLKRARGEYITFIDDDDYVSPTFLKELYACSSDKIVGVSNTIAFEDMTGLYDTLYSLHKVFLKYRNQSKKSIVQARKYFNGPCMKLIHRDIIGQRRFDCRYINGEDSLFMFLISDRIQYVSFTSEKSIYYRRYRINSATTVKRSRLKIIANSSSLIMQYTFIMLSGIYRYNPVFYITRVLAELHSWFI